MIVKIQIAEHLIEAVVAGFRKRFFEHRGEQLVLRDQPEYVERIRGRIGCHGDVDHGRCARRELDLDLLRLAVLDFVLGKRLDARRQLVGERPAFERGRQLLD